MTAVFTILGNLGVVSVLFSLGFAFGAAWASYGASRDRDDRL